MGLGLLLAGLSGAGQAVDESLQSSQKYNQASDLQAQNADLQAQKAIQVNAANTSLATATADQQRQQTASRIQTAAAPYMQQAILANAMKDPDFVARNTIADGTVAPTLSPDDIAKYAPTSQQQLAATVAGAKDTGDIAPQSLLQAQLSDQANQRMTDAQVAQLQTQRDLSANQIQAQKDAETAREKNQLAVADLYANRGGANDPGVQAGLNIASGYERAAQEHLVALKALQTNLQDVRPKLPDGTDNPEYAQAKAAIATHAAAFEDLQAKANSLYGQVGSKTGLTIPTESAAPTASSGSGAQWVLDPKSGTLVQAGGAAAGPLSIPK